MAIKTHSLRIMIGVMAAVTLLGDSVMESGFQKLGSIEGGGLPRGSRVSFTRGEIDAIMQEEARVRFPHGLTNVRLDLGVGRAVGYATIDFLKVRQAANAGDPGWLMKNLFGGERPAVLTVRFSSASGKARVDVERVEISGVPIEGAALDFVIANYVRPTFPDVKVNEWFPLNFGVDRIGVANTGVVVSLRK